MFVDSLREEELIRKFSKKALILSRKYFLMGGDSEDLFQEGMIGLISAIRSFAGEEAAFSAYAEKCIRNRMIDAIRSRGYSEFISSEELEFEGEWKSAEDSLIEKENFNELLSSIKQRLSKLEYSVLELYLSGMSLSEIAEKLGKPQSSVYNAVQRARQKISAK